MLRPDISTFNPSVFSNFPTYFTNHRDLGPCFMQIAGRPCTHSIIYRRSGMQKILNFYKTYRLFTDYSSELAIIPNLRLFCLKENVTSYYKTSSDADEHLFSRGKEKIVCPWDRGDPWPQ